MARGGSGGGGGRWRRLKVTPDLASDQEGTRTLNLTVLRRLDPAVADILIIAAHVVLYSFDDNIHQWSRRPVEGSLFVVKRNTQPRFQFIVMNRKNTENLTEDLLGGFEYQVQVPFILYHNAADEITGIWFYDPQECEQVGYLFSRIQKAFSRVSPKSEVSVTESEYEKPEVVPAVPSNEDALKQPTSSIMVPNNAEYDFLSALLKGAACVGATMDEASAVQSNKSVGMHFYQPAYKSCKSVVLSSDAIFADSFSCCFVIVFCCSSSSSHYHSAASKCSLAPALLPTDCIIHSTTIWHAITAAISTSQSFRISYLGSVLWPPSVHKRPTEGCATESLSGGTVD
uniref:WH1 domain-containing protein n=1 Tax=Oryza punctata TaxID=4537 RepID=A0A0E0KL87_ORYPU